MADHSSHFLWLSTHPHRPISASPTEGVLAQRTVHATGMSTTVLQHAHARRSETPSRSNGTTATPIHSLYASHLSLTTAPTQSHHSRSSTSRRAPSPLVRHHSSSSSSAGNASAAESFTSYTHMAGHFRQPSPGIPPQLANNYSVVSLRSPSASRPSMGDSIHNAPGALSLQLTRKNSSIGSGVILADSLHTSSTATSQVQRVDVKRLMSKPRAVLPPSSIPSHSILSIPAYPESPKTLARASSSLGDDETADRKTTTHVGRRRRSRTLDELMLTTAISIPIRPPLVNQVTDSTSTPTTPTTPTIPTPGSTLRPHQAAGPPFTTGETTTTALKSPTMTATVRPKEAINMTVASADYHIQRTTVWLDNPTRATVLPTRQAASLDLHRTGNLTPASALVLAWNESQRQQLQRSPDSSSHRSPPLPSPGEPPPQPQSQNLSDADTRSYGPRGHTVSGSFFDSSARGAKVVAVGGPEEGTEGPYHMWAMVEEKLRQTARTPSGGVKGLKRRVTGRFSQGKDKNKEREKEKEREKKSESMGALHPSSVYPATSSRQAMLERQKIESGLERLPTDVVIPHPRGSSLTALSSTMGSRKSSGDITNFSNPTVPEFGSYRSQVTPTGSAMDINHPYSTSPSVPGSESSQTPASSARVRSKSPAPLRSASEPVEGGTGKLWKLVRKLSNGALRQRFANEQGDSSVSPEDLPPVPALPKDFDLIDHHAYTSERNQEHAQGKPLWVSQQRVAALGPVENPGSSRTQSPFTMQSPLVLPTSPPSTSQGSPPNSYTQHVAASISTLSLHPYPPRGKHGNKTPAHKPSSSTTSGNSASMSGNEFSFRSTSPGFSSSVASDIMSSKVMTSPYSQRSSVSSNSELHTTTAAVAVARPIVPPEELLRIHHEDFLARQQAQSDAGHGGASSGRVQPRGPRIHIKHSNKSSAVNNAMLSSPTSPPPPSSSPVIAHPLSAPPRRQTLGNAPLEHVQARARHGDRSPGPTVQAPSRAKSMHDPPIPRSLSSPPGSPLMPSFANDRPANMFDNHSIPHARSTSLRQSGSFNSLSPSSSSPGDSLPPRSKVGRLSSVNALAVRRHVAKTNHPVHVASPIARQIERNISILSPSADNSSLLMDGHYEPGETAEKSKKPRLNTSNSLLAKVRSRSVKSGSALESNGTDLSHMTSKTAPARLSYNGKQRGWPRSYVEVGRVPFTATAFAFRELNHDSPVSKPTLTEQEREDRWAALLARSDRAGGTLTAKLEGGVLLSDAMSTTED